MFSSAQTILMLALLVPSAVAAAPTASAPASAPAIEIDSGPRRALIVAIAKWRGEDFNGAGMDFSKLINTATPEQREALSGLAESLTRRSLAELAADTHWQAAMAARRGSAIRFRYVTEYEKPVLMPRLSAAYEQTLREKQEYIGQVPVAAPPPADRPAKPASTSQPAPATQPWYMSLPKAQSQPASSPADEREPDSAVLDWLSRPDKYDGSPEQAKVLAPRVYHALSLLNERLRLDPTVRKYPNLKRQLMQDRQGLGQLGKAVTARMSRKSPSVEPPAPTEAELEQRRQYQERMQAQHDEELKRVQEAQKQARKWQEQQDQAAEKKPGLFDWFKSKDKQQSSPPVTEVKPAEPPAGGDQKK